MSDFAVKGAELKKMIKVAKKGPIAFGYNPGTSEDDAFLGFHRTKSPAVVGKAAKEEGEGGKFSFGTAVVDGKVLRLNCERELPQMAKKLKRFLKSQKVMLNVVICDANGNTVDSDIEEGLPDDPDLAEDDAPAVAASAPTPPPPTPPAAAAPPAPTEDPLVAKWAAAAARLAPLVAEAASKALVDPQRLRAAWAMAQETAAKGNLAGALQVADKITALLQAGGGDGHATPGQTDPNSAKWGLAKAKIEPHVTQALSRGAGDVGKIRAVWDFALGKAEAGQYPAALQSLTALAGLIAAAKQAPGANADVAPGLVAARTAEVAEGQALLETLKGLLPALSGAMKILPDRADAVKADIAAAKSGSTGNDAEAAKGALARLRAFIEAAEAHRAEVIRRRDAALITLQSLAADPDGSREPEVAAHNAQRKIAQDVLNVEFPTLPALGTAEAACAELQRLLTQTTERVAETQRRKTAITAALPALSDPEGATEAEKTALKDQRKAVTDQTDAAHPTDEALTLADTALVALRDSHTKTTARIAETKRRRAEVEALHKAKEAEIAHALQLEGETAVALKAQRKLTAQEAEFAKLMAADQFDKAQALIAQIALTVAALTAEEAEIAKAIVLRDKLVAEYAALAGTLKSARALYAVTPAFDADVKTFANADYWAAAKMKNRTYASGFPALDTLKSAATALLARKAEFDTGVTRRELATQKRIDANAKTADIDGFSPQLPDLKADCTAFKSALVAAKDMFKARDFDGCITQCDEALRLWAAIMPRKAESDAETPKMNEAKARYLAARDPLTAARSLTKVAPEFIKLMAAFEASEAALIKAFNSDKDFTAALARVAEIEAQAAQIAARIAENEAAILAQTAVMVEYNKNKALLDQALKIKVYTKDGLTTKTAFDDAYKVFCDATAAGAATAQATLDAAVIAAKALAAIELAEVAQRAAAKTAMDDALAAVRPKIIEAAALATANRPALDPDNAILDTLIGQTNTFVAAKSYIQAVDCIEKITVVTDRMIAAKATAEAATLLLKPQFEAQWSPAIKADLVTARSFAPDMLADLKPRLDKIFAHEAKIKDSLAKARWQAGMDEIAALTPLLTGVIAQKAVIEQNMVDSGWLKTQYAADKTDIDLAKTIDAVDRETAAKVAELKAITDKFFALRDAKNFAQARAIYPARLAAAKAVVALKAVYDIGQAKKALANTAWSAVDADYKAAAKIKALTPELDALLKTFHAANAHFDDAYFGFDYDAAVSRAPAVGVTARAVLAVATAKVKVIADDGTETEVDAYDKLKLDATAAAASAESEIDTLSPADLKATKTAEQKVALLEKLRGQKEPLTDKQREMQRKVYAAMDLDPAFVLIDDKRRAELTDAIRADEALMNAKTTWTTIDIPARIALLQKTLETECAIYGMPVPKVVTFEEPMPGDLGSFNSGNNMIRINVHPSATFDDFHDTVDTIVHENAHNYQGYLVTKLEEGLLQPGDPEYVQALMFASNSVAHSYVTGEEDRDIYEKQPLEEHAWKTGDGVKHALLTPPPPKGP